MSKRSQRDSKRYTDAQRRADPAFWQVLGLPEPRYTESGDPPEVDELDQDELRRLVRGYVSEERAREVLRLVYTYKNWREAYDRIVGEEVDGGSLDAG